MEKMAHSIPLQNLQKKMLTVLPVVRYLYDENP
jgi:hypothetical protein